jgi:peptidoglycan/LPS O-acetylase OafA/YrhL
VFFFLGVWCLYVGISFTASTSHVRLLMFISGIMLYEALSSQAFKRLLTARGEAAAVLLFIVSLVFTFAYQVRPDAESLLPGAHAGNTLLPGITTYQGPYKVIVLGLSAFFFTLYCFGFKGFLSRAFSWRPLRYLGNMSYSYFLFHGAALKVLSLLAFSIVPPVGRSPVLFCVALPFSFGATWISSTLLFACVERPISLERLSLRAYLGAVRAHVRDMASSLGARRARHIGFQD